MKIAASLIVSGSMLALAACATAPAASPPVEVVPAIAPVPPVPEPQVSAHDRLFQLFKDSDEASLKRNPLQALFRGDMRYADQLGDFITDAYFAGELAAAEQDLATLHAIPRDQLNETDQLAYDVFESQTKDTIRGLQPDLLSLTKVQPINHFFGFHTFYPTLSSGKGAAPFKTVEDYDNALKRHAQFVTYIDRAIGRFKE